MARSKSRPSEADAHPPNEADRLGSFVFSFGALGYVSAAALAANIILARVLSEEEIGHIRVIRTVIEFAAIPAMLGMSDCISTFVADRAAGLRERARMLATASTICLASAAAVAMLAFGLLQAPGILKDQTALAALKWMIFLVPALALYGCLQGHLRGMGQVRRLGLVQTGRATGLLILSAALAWRWGFAGWTAARTSAELLALGLGVAAIWKLRPFRPDLTLLKPFLRFGLYMALIQSLSAVMITVDVLCLDRYLDDPRVLGHYAIAMLIFTTALLLPHAYVQATYSRMAAWGLDARRTWRAFGRDMAIVFALALPAGVAGYFAAAAIPWIFSAKFEPSVRIFRWLLPAFLIQSPGVVAGYYLAAARRLRLNFISALITALTSLALNIILIPRWGVAGAVISTTLTYAVRMLMCMAILYRYQARAVEREKNGC